MAAEFPRVPRVWSGAVFSPGRFGIVHPGLPWVDVMKAYYWDNLKVAMMLADENGLGVNGNYLPVYRMIEAEHLTRENSVLSDRGDWLLLEYQVDDDGDSIEIGQQLEALVRKGCDQVCSSFGWSHGPAVLFTMLHPVTNAPYVPGRSGFFIDKYPFDKICLPAALMANEEEFLAAVRHEYAHAMVLNRTIGRSPTWLHEAVAMMAQENGAPPDRSPWTWRSALDLAAAFRADRESDSGSRVVSDAYRQSHQLGWYLYSLKGSKGIGDFLDGFADNTFGRELLMRVTNQSPEDEALHQIFGFGVKELFERAQRAVS